MDGRRIDAVTDESLDREIHALLAAEPSPEFVARVRARVAQEPQPGRWRAALMLAVPTAVAGIVVLAMLWPSSELLPADTQPAVRQLSQQSEPVDAPDTIAAPPVQQIRRPSATAPVVAAAAPDGAIELDLPEVVIADNEVRGYQALLASIRRSGFHAAVPAREDPNTPVEIAAMPPVEPLEIEPIVKLAALQPEGERP